QAPPHDNSPVGQGPSGPTSWPIAAASGGKSRSALASRDLLAPGWGMVGAPPVSPPRLEAPPVPPVTAPALPPTAPPEPPAAASSRTERPRQASSSAAASRQL